MAEKPDKKYIEVAGDWELSDQKLAGKIRQSFLDVATAEGNRGKTWITRSAGLGKNIPNTGLKQLYTSGTKSLQYTGGRRTFDEYVQADKDIKQKYFEWKKKGKTGPAPPRNIQETQKSHLNKPRTTIGSIITHAAKEYNKNLRLKGLQDKMPEKAIQAMLAEKEIKVLPITASKFTGEGISWHEGKDRREAYIKGIGAKQKAYFTRSGTLESKPEQMAREFYNQVAEYVKARGVRTKTATTKVRDYFIDAVNAKKFKNKAVEKEFKAGARQFLFNKELDIQFKNPDQVYLTEDALESIKGWHPGSKITDLMSAGYEKQKYHQFPGDIESKYVGSKTITAEASGQGPDLPENVKLASTSQTRDYGINVDRMTERYVSSHFAEMIDDEGNLIQKFQNPLVETPVTSWMDELGSQHEGTIKETKVLTTKPLWVTSVYEDKFSDVPDYNPPTSPFAGQGKGGKIAHTWMKEGQVYWSEQVDTGVTPSEYVEKLNVADPPKTALTTNLRAAQQHAHAVTTSYSTETDAVKEFLKPPAEFDAQTGEMVSAVAPTVDTNQHMDRTNLLMQQDMENIEAKYGNKDKNTLLTAYDAGKVGQSVNPDQNAIKPVKEIRTQLMEDAGTTSVTAIPGEKQKIVKPTFEEKVKLSQWKEFTQNEPDKWDAYVQKKIAEYNERGQKPYVKLPPVKGDTIAHLKKGDKVSSPTENFLKFMGKRETPAVDRSEYLVKNMTKYMDDPYIGPSNQPIDDFPENVYEQGSQMSAKELLMDDQYEEMKANNARIEAARNAPKIPQFKPGDVLTYGIGGKTQSFDVVVSKGENIHGINVVYSKAPETKGWKSTEVSTGRSLFSGGTRKEVIAATQKHFGDPKNVEKALSVIKDVRKKNITTGAGPSPETIELFKSRVTGEYMTQGKVKKTAVKQLGKNVGKIIKGPGGTSTLGIFGMLMAPIGAMGDVVRHEKAKREKLAMKYPPYRKKKSGLSLLIDAPEGSYEQAFSHRISPESMGGLYPSLDTIKKRKYMDIQ